MIETLQTLKEFQRTSGRVLQRVPPETYQPPYKHNPDLGQGPCPECLANKAKALARVKAHRARRRATGKDT